MNKAILHFFFFCSFISNSFAQSIPLALTKPLDVGACWLNSYVAHYPGTGAAQRISIQSSINLNGNTPPSCGYSNGSLVVVDSIKENGVPISATNIVVILDSGKWSGTLPQVDTSDTVFIYYHILIDCSVIPVISPINSMSLIPNWTDSVPGSSFSINATGYSADTSNTIKYPILVNNSGISDSLGYKDTVAIKFFLRNTGTGPASVYVSLNPDAPLCSGEVDTISYYHQIGISGTPVRFDANDSFLVALPVNDTLIITQNVSANTCLNPCNVHSELKWRCATLQVYDTLFCDSCRGTIGMPYSLYNEESPELLIERITPANRYLASYDISCANDTTEMREWKYKISTRGPEYWTAPWCIFLIVALTTIIHWA